MPFTVLVTVGTTQFDGLVQAVYDDGILDVVSKHEAPRILIQCGVSRVPADVSTRHSSIFGTDCAYTQLRGVDIYAFPYIPSLGELLNAADVVIAHAGAGTILETLRARSRPRLLVVPNGALMDNHQRELAEALQDKYLCVGSIACVFLTNRTLGHDLRHTLAAEFSEFPPQAPRVLGDIVRSAWR